MEFRLIVIRSNKLQEMVDFYSQFGFVFDYHQHGNGIFHYASMIENCTFEIYPLLKSQTTPDTSTRLGFAIEEFESVLTLLNPERIVKPPSQTEWGEMAIVQDPDGRKIELYKKHPPSY